jgi:ComF family protein
MLQLLPDAVLSLIYPQDCSVCEREVTSASDGVACSDCWDKTRIFDGSETLCSKCGAFLFGPQSSGELPRCQRCEDHHYDRAYSVGIYEYALKASVLSLKKIPHASGRLEQEIAKALSQIPLDGYTVMPTPLSPRRLRERGFNQASILARTVANLSGNSFDEQTLVRKSHTPMHRAGMDKKAREVTVKKAFEVVRPKLIEGRAVLLVDDVLTSGATASACAEVLKKNGACEVNILTAARAA